MGKAHDSTGMCQLNAAFARRRHHPPYFLKSPACVVLGEMLEDAVGVDRVERAVLERQIPCIGTHDVDGDTQLRGNSLGGKQGADRRIYSQYSIALPSG